MRHSRLLAGPGGGRKFAVAGVTVAGLATAGSAVLSSRRISLPSEDANLRDSLKYGYGKRMHQGATAIIHLIPHSANRDHLAYSKEHQTLWKLLIVLQQLCNEMERAQGTVTMLHLAAPQLPSHCLPTRMQAPTSPNLS
jgi:hypothetical protein